MRRYTILLLVLFLAVSSHASDKNTSKSLQQENATKEIPGSELITNEQFKKDLLEFLAIDAKLDYLKEYSYLSKNYLTKHFPDIRNAEEYKKHKENTSERSAPKYLEIVDVKKADEKYQVELIHESMAEGVMYRITEKYFFVNEDGKWKYNGKELVDYKAAE